ncbi:hypothetical protein M422DRAFT_241201 [Sphaerobolus stellatus SS14]|nr:hypothetical protein M422DRAFT_241201 [Sphaerobolus stellatus SS14]
MGILYEEELAELTALFDNLPQNLPQYPSNSTLPPEIDQDLLQDEGAWVTFNNAMDSAFEGFDSFEFKDLEVISEFFPLSNFDEGAVTHGAFIKIAQAFEGRYVQSLTVEGFDSFEFKDLEVISEFFPLVEILHLYAAKMGM